jgi:predicted Rossmann fold nucleotide-binding protein DprA/Smf involved in DNA uptake
MSTVMLDADGQVIALACSGVAGTGGPRPLTAKDWNDLRQVIHASRLERPGKLLGLSAHELRESLGINFEAAERLHGLLSRGGQLAIELERLAARGIWLMTRADSRYPVLLRRRLGELAPPVLFGSGQPELLTTRGIAVVGSRDASEDALAFASGLGAQAAAQSYAVVSGAARGVDTFAMQGGLEAGGVAIGLIVDPLERMVRRRELREFLERGSLVLATPFHPNARWHAGNAMRRNRLIYALAEAAVVVATSADKGGTWAGAVENLRNRWVPLWVREDGSPGARALLAEGARGLPPRGVETLDVPLLSQEKVSSLDGVGDGRLVAPSRTQTAGDVEHAPLPNQFAMDADGPVSGAGGVASSPSGELVRQEPGASGDVLTDLFVLVWPAIAAYLRQPRTADDVAERFDLALSQARAWLSRAVDEGRADVRTKPKRYVVNGGAERATLFVP